MTKKIIFNLFLKGMLVSLFFVLPLGLEAKNIDIGTKNDQISIPGTLCINGDCKDSWSQAGLWEKSINNNNIYYNAGNIGIGTSNPTAALDILMTDGVRINGPLALTGTTYDVDGPSLLVINDEGSVYPANIFSTVGLPSSAIAGQTLRHNGTSWVANSNLFNNGTNVGIGTSNPLSLLNLYKNSGSVLRLTGDVNSGVSGAVDLLEGVGLFGTSNTYGARLFYEGVDNKFYIQTGSQTALNTRFTIERDSGNVGIGTTAPAYKLDVVGGAKFTQVVDGVTPLETQTNALTTVSYVNSALSNPTTAIVGFWTKNANNTIYNTNLANVGIGKTNPTQKLDVTGNAIVSGNVGIGIANPSTARLQISNLANTEGLRIIASNYSPLVIRNTADNSDLLRLNQEGKLELNSSLKVGNTGDVCDASNTGAIKHNPVSGQSYICNGKMWLNQNNCGMVADEDGNTYGTVQIGGQCWMTENMRVGTMLASASTKPNTGDQVIEKWCYDNDPANCEIYGGLYDWNEAMRGSEVSGAQGICPSGWHIPTDAEINELEKTAVAIINSSNSQYPCDLNSSGWQRCADNIGGDYGANGAGSALRQVGLGTGVGNGTDLVGFSGNLPGHRALVFLSTSWAPICTFGLLRPQVTLLPYGSSTTITLLSPVSRTIRVAVILCVASGTDYGVI